jgi:orotate phosphoribosyltransferase
MFNPDFIQAIGTLFFYKIEKEIGHFNFQITGLETGSTPMISTFPLIGKMYDIHINAFSIRKTQKEYGLKNWIEGVVNSKVPCLLVDDLCNSSASMKIAYDVLKLYNLPTMDYAFTIVNKVNKDIHLESRVQTDMYLPSSIKMIYLFDLDDFNLYNPSH